jgi:MFS family permease
MAGTYIAIEDALESALTADLVPDESVRGTAFGVMGTVNGVGDLLSSVIVGVLWWWIGPLPGFVFSAIMMLLGAGLLYRVR